MTTSRRAVAGAAGMMVLASACAGTPAEPAASGSPSQVPVTAPTAVGEAIEPLRSIAGAERHTVEGVSFDVPEGMEVREFDAGVEGETAVRVVEPGAQRSAATITVFDSPAATWESDENVDTLSYVTEGRAAATLEWADFERFEVPWEGMSYAVAFTMVSTEASGDPGREAILVVARNEAKDDVVSLTAEAPDGPVEESVGYEILRTVRFGK